MKMVRRDTEYRKGSSADAGLGSRGSMDGLKGNEELAREGSCLRHLPRYQW